MFLNSKVACVSAAMVAFFSVCDPIEVGAQTQSFVLSLRKAEGGSAADQYEVARCYLLGKGGVQQNYSTAITWLTKAADQGLAIAQYNLGVLYKEGQGLEPDLFKAFDWFLKAAIQGDANAQVAVGASYENGWGVAVDLQKAFDWYYKAAIQGDEVAQDNLGMCYVNGRGTTPSATDAASWFAKAADKGYALAQSHLGFCFANGLGVAQDIQRALDWYRRAVDQGEPSAQCSLGECYYYGMGVAVSYAKAFELFLQAAKTENIAAQYFVGLCYDLGNGIVQDYQQAINWYTKAAEAGDDFAQYNLATCYEYGRGVPQSYVNALEWYRRAAEAGNAEAAKRQEYISMVAQSGVKSSKPPIISIVEGSVRFEDATGNNAIDAGEECKIIFQVRNTGEGDGIGCKAEVSATGEVSDVTFHRRDLEPILAGGVTTVTLPIVSGMNIVDGKIAFSVKVSEPAGFGTETMELVVSTRRFDSPLLKVVDYSLSGTTGGSLSKKVPFDLQILLQNIKPGAADNVEAALELPAGVTLLDGSEKVAIGPMAGGDKKSLSYTLIVKSDYQGDDIPVRVRLSERHGKYAEDSEIHLKLNQSLHSGRIVVDEKAVANDIQIASLGSDVDKNIPQASASNPNTFAVIIANENYQNVEAVHYALNDGRVFAQYCQQTLGLPASNVHVVTNATLNNMKSAVNWVVQVMNAYNGKARVIFYYAGHGIPDERQRDAYLLPVDGVGTDFSSGYSLGELYSQLGKAPSQSVTVLLDACFSGSKRDGGMLASARGVAIKVKSTQPQGPMVVFSAAQGDETAFPNDSQQHGMFTYFLLKKIQESKGDVSFAELGDYLTTQVRQQSIVINHKSQTPTVIPSLSLGDKWKEWRLK